MDGAVGRAGEEVGGRGGDTGHRRIADKRGERSTERHSATSGANVAFAPKCDLSLSGSRMKPSVTVQAVE